MALVPFTVPSSAPAAPPVSSPRATAGRAAQPDAIGGVRPPRAGSDVPGPTRSTGSKPKAPPAFAQVLAAARDDEAAASKAQAAAGGRSRQAGSAEEPPAATPRLKDDDEQMMTTAPVAPDDERRTLPASSWLLLALGQSVGPIGRSSHDTAIVSPDTAGDDEVGELGAVMPIDPAAVAGLLALPVTPLAMASADTVQPGPFEIGSTGEIAAELELLQAGHPVPAALAATAGVDADAIEAAGNSANGAQAAGLNEALVEGAAPVAGEVAAESATLAASNAVAPSPDESDVRPTPEALARWRSAARALAAPGPRVATVGTEAAGVAATPAGPSGSSPGAAARALAHLLGGSGRTADTPGQLHWNPSVSGRQPDAAAVGPVARAVEVLGRLAQPPAEAQVELVRATEQAASSVFGGMLAAASRPEAPAPVSAPAPAATLPPAVGEQVNAHIVSSLKMQWKDGVGEAKLHLRPDAHGSVTVSLRVEHGAVTAVVRSDSAQVQDWVLQHQQSLRQQMEAAGLRLDDLTVAPDDKGQGGQDEPADQRRRARRGKSQDADEPVFELLA